MSARLLGRASARGRRRRTALGLAVAMVLPVAGIAQLRSPMTSAAAPTPEIHDTFSRTVTGGWGRADTGGRWTMVIGGRKALSVNGKVGRIDPPGRGRARIAALRDVELLSVDAHVKIGFARLPARPVSGWLLLRGDDQHQYRVGVLVDSSGQVALRGVKGDGQALFSRRGVLQVKAGNAVRLRVRAIGTDPTALRAKVWRAGTAQPSSWTVRTQDTTAALQRAGWVGAGAIAEGPRSTRVRFDGLVARTVGDVASPSSSPSATPSQSPSPSNSPSQGLWQARASSGPNRQEVSYVQLGGKFYLAWGNNLQHEVYNPVNNSWTRLNDLPARLDHIQGIALGNRIYYIGGLAGWPKPAVRTVYIYNPSNDTMTEGAQIPAGRARGAGGLAVYQGKIYYAGGLHDGTARKWFDVYDPVADTWTTLPDMPRARDHFQGAVVGNRFYAIAGRDTTINAMTAAVDAYDFGTKKWVTGLWSLPTARGGFATAVVGGEIFVIGGEGGTKTYDQVEAYNPSTDRWRSLNPMPTKRHGIQAAVCNGGIYIAAGGKTQGGGSPTDVHEVLFPGGTARSCP